MHQSLYRRLLDYANVIAWLVENGEFVGADLLPEDLEPLYLTLSTELALVVLLP